jgi:pimeloyl-ACP methyl ester carboxylesterase
MSYLRIGDVDLWYDESGTGEPVVLLHGAMSDSRDFDGNLAALASEFRVLRVDRRGHGHTADTDGPLTLDLMADDMIRFAECLAEGQIAVAGYSAGAGVALRMATRRPDLVSALVLISGAYDRAGLIVRPVPGGSWPPQVIAAYGEVSPDGEGHFPVVADKVAASIDQGSELSPRDLAQLTCPSLVLAADDDVVSLEHTIALYRALPDAYLSIVPGASHLLLHEHPELCTLLVRDFLAGKRGPRLMPMRRPGQVSPA